MKNTKISYRYTDASNYKQSATCVLSGALDHLQISFIKEFEDFIPCRVKLNHLHSLFGETPTEDDHPYHTLGCIELTDEEADNARITAEEFYEAFVTGEAIVEISLEEIDDQFLAK